MSQPINPAVRSGYVQWAWEGVQAGAGKAYNFAANLLSTGRDYAVSGVKWSWNHSRCVRQSAQNHPYLTALGILLATGAVLTYRGTIAPKTWLGSIQGKFASWWNEKQEPKNEAGKTPAGSKSGETSSKKDVETSSASNATGATSGDNKGSATNQNTSVIENQSEDGDD